jgi:hypothetical protein
MNVHNADTAGFTQNAGAMNCARRETLKLQPAVALLRMTRRSKCRYSKEERSCVILLLKRKKFILTYLKRNFYD